ncbi:balbiani ring protein 3-like [Chironomus tepperi]|uniref:balbiani ring protein 3-like n=1 Tax=Chironomus tepperi TaxID=113505 RepID=UPI00391F1A48
MLKLKLDTKIIQNSQNSRNPAGQQRNAPPTSKAGERSGGSDQLTSQRPARSIPEPVPTTSRKPASETFAPVTIKSQNKHPQQKPSIFAKCINGFIFDEESCSCIKSSTEPSLCPSLTCPKGQHINEARCECTDKICQTLVACPSNTIIDLETCECICNFDPSSCPEYYIFDEFNCKCRHPVCDPPGPCPGNSVWDTELCQCKCSQRNCSENFVFNAAACDCISIDSSEPSKTRGSPDSGTGTSSSCYIPDCRWCDYLNEEECYCNKLYLECGEGYIIDDEGCGCKPDPNYRPPVGDECINIMQCMQGFELNTQSCQCEPIYETPSTSISCSIPDCRPCDHLDMESCECYRVVVDCWMGYQNSEDGCSCEPIPGYISPSPDTCMDVFCPDNSVVNPENCQCQCIENVMCIQNYIFNPETCQCEPTNETPSTSLSCSIPDCRPCDYLDLDSCECHRVVVDCWFGYQNSEDGCSCEPIPGYVSPSPDTCMDASCPEYSVLNPETCQCQCIENVMCIQNYVFNPSNCQCEPSGCSIPDCRWCDYFDYENCECHRYNIECSEGFQISDDGCGCIEIPYENSTQSSSIESSPPCYIESCRWCDMIDLENCACQRVYVDCAWGYDLSPDGCSCIRSTCASPNCPGVYCDPDTYIDEISCECISTSPSPSSSTNFTSETSCILPDYCRWCDVLDIENCDCHKVVIDCSEGYQLSEDGCSCDWIGFTPESESSTEEVTVMQSSTDLCGSNPPPYCRWCDYYDTENCICHMRYVDCYWGFQLSPDGCTCMESNMTMPICDGLNCGPEMYIDESTCECIPYSSDSLISETSSSMEDTSSSPSSTETSTQVPCLLPFCRSCDILDSENCACHRIVIDCYEGYELSEDGCDCVKSNSTSEKCPGIFCSKGTFIDEKTCQCLSDACKSAEPCQDNLIMDSESCHCFCPLNPSDCTFPSRFDHSNCKCRHPPCDPPGPCPNNLSWDPEACKCRCIQNKPCDSNFIFNNDTCDCTCDPKMMNTSCPSGSVFDSSLCDCIEEIDCYDFDDPACACECEEILDCPPGKEFDLDACDCLCPLYPVDACQDGFVRSEETCECVKE